MKTKFEKWMNNEKMVVSVMVLLILFVTGLPYLKSGISGYEPDLLFHMLRIEGVKDALLDGNYPTQIYYNMFDGYGYGSPLFYPDIFLVIPALMRMAGISPTLTWRLFALVIVFAATTTTYFSFRHILGQWKYAVAGTTLLLLSQFYLADLINRIGISEYLAYIFLPLWLCGLYDFIEGTGKKTHLMGIAFVGMLLSHTIMTFLAVILTIIIFGFILFMPRKRRHIFQKQKLLHLAATAVACVACSLFYLLPMIEQMVTADYKYSEPWAHVSEYTQPLSVLFYVTGHFDWIAYVGIGIPILLLLCCRLFLGKSSRPWAEVFYWGGLFLFLITTDIFPWRLLDNTIFNMIQFPYRLYPYALCFLILGIMMTLADGVSKERINQVWVCVVGMAALFGLWQNFSIILDTGFNNDLTEEYIARHSYEVGKGEWLPVSINDEVIRFNEDGSVMAVTGERRVTCGNMGIAYSERKGDRLKFATIEGTVQEYIVPYIYYKGYVATLITEQGEKKNLPVSQSGNGLLLVKNNTGKQGDIVVYYQGTRVQKISLVVSIGAVILLLGRFFYKKRYRNSLNNKCIGAR